MAYYLNKPCTNQERADFIVLHNHQNGRAIRQTETQLIALEENEVFENGQVVVDEEYYKRKEEEAKKKEQERIANLNMTRGDFFEGLILAQGKDEDDVLVLIDVLDLTDIEKKIAKSRVKNALDFYRGYPLIDKMCEYLKLSTEQMTMFFETRDYKYLIPVVVEEIKEESNTNEIVDDTTGISGEEAS